MTPEHSGPVVVTDLATFLRQPVPAALDLELTERCDNACLHCAVNLPLDDAQALAREMPTARVKQVLSEAADLGVLSLRITGGEPLVRADFEEVYLHARRLGLEVTLLTNARRVTPGLADLFREIPPRGHVCVTVYGMSRATYEHMTRRPGSYDEFRRGVDLLVSSGVPLRLNGAFLSPYVDEMRALVAWARTLPTVVGTPNEVMFYDLRRSRDSESRNRAIAELRPAPDEVLAAGALAAGHEAVTVRFCRSFCGPRGDLLFTCGVGLKPTVDAYGVAHACASLWDPQLSVDLSTTSLREAVEDVFPRLRELRATDAAYLERCARCFLRGLCQQCPARSYIEHGVLDRPVDYHCEAAQAQARRLGLLSADERPWHITDWKERIACLTE